MNAHEPLFSDDRESPTTSRIVVGFDGSPAARAALARASEMAEAQRAVLDVVTAWRYPVGSGAFSVAPGWSPREDAGRTLREGLRQRFGDTVPEWVRAHVREGTPARVLIDAGEGADTLVVGSRGHGGFAGLLLGSVSAACAEHATCPVLIIHADDDSGRRPGRASRGAAVHR